MRQIINGKRYDTEAPKTTLLLDDLGPSSLGPRDHQWWRAGLYMTGKGALFLAGSGGPASMFSKSVGNASTGGDGIIPLTPEQAREHLESEGHRAAEVLEQLADKLSITDA